MQYWNSYEIFQDTYLVELYDSIVPLIEKFFSEKNYGNEFYKLRTIINCSPNFDFKIRSRFNRKEKLLFFDIIIDYPYYMNLTNAARKECIALSFLRDMEVLKKYKPEGFVIQELKQDFKTFFQEIGWLLSD